MAHAATCARTSRVHLYGGRRSSERMRLLPASNSCKLEGACRRWLRVWLSPHAFSRPGLPAALARLAARRFLARAPRAHVGVVPPVAALRSPVVPWRSGTAQPPRVVQRYGARREAYRLDGPPSSSAVRHTTRLFAARAPATSSSDVAELAKLFELSAKHECKNGYSNAAGRQFPNFGAFLLHALERVGAAGCATGNLAAAWAQASEDAKRYPTLRVPERSALVVRHPHHTTAHSCACFSEGACNPSLRCGVQSCLALRTTRPCRLSRCRRRPSLQRRLSRLPDRQSRRRRRFRLSRLHSRYPSAPPSLSVPLRLLQ